MTSTRQYNNDKRAAQAAETRNAILAAFSQQLIETGRDALSPSDAAAATGLSVRTIHTHFPTHESRIIGLADYFDAQLYPGGVQLASGPDDLPRYYRDIHAMALKSRLSYALVSNPGLSGQVRQQRRAKRLDAIRAAVKEIGAPKRDTEDATAMLLSLSGADASWPMHDLYGLPIARIPDVIANTVALIVADLRAKTRR